MRTPAFSVAAQALRHRPRHRPSHGRSRARLVLFCVSIFCAGDAIAQSTQTPALPKRSMQMGEPWEQGAGLSMLRADEKDFVRRLDRAWSTGNPRAVLRCFEFLHPQLRKALKTRVLLTTGGRPVTRKSEFLCRQVDSRPDGRSFTALWLKTTLFAAAEAGKKPQDSLRDEAYELLVIERQKAKASAPIARLLLQTTPEWQSHVKPATGKLKEHPARSLGRGMRFSCPVCNYEVGSPDMGAWVVIARPSFLSACIEAVEVFSLEKDLSMEVSVHPILEGSKTKPRDWLARCAEELELCLCLDAKKLEHGARAGKGPPRRIVPITQGGADGFRTDIEVRTRRAGKRAYRLFAFRSGSADYLFAIEGSPESLARAGSDCERLLGTFKILDRKNPVRYQTLLDAFGGPGKFSPDGSEFRIEALGLCLEGFKDWKRNRRIGVSQFDAGWTLSKGRASLRILGIERRSGVWSGPSTLRYLGQIVERNRSRLSPKPGFEIDSPLTALEVAGRRAYRLAYRYAPGWSRGASKSKSQGFLIAIPVASTLLLVSGEAAAGKDQEELLEGIEGKARRLRLH